MRCRRPLVILDDFFVRNELVAAILQSDDADWAKGDFIELPASSPFARRLFSATHSALRRWVRTDDVQITYSSWLYYTHLLFIAAVGARLLAGLTAAPLVYSLSTLTSICLVLVLSYHVSFFLSLNYHPTWFEQASIYHSPFAWAAIWLLVFFGDDREVSTVAIVDLDGPVRSMLDRRVGPLALLLMHVFVWYMRRTVIGVTVFERKIRASLCAYWFHRLYSVLAALAIVLAWRWAPYLSTFWDRATLLDVPPDRTPLREWIDERSSVGLLRLAATMLVSGTTHALWYSFISYAYHMVMWRVYMREGVVVWVIGDSAMCTRLH
ncbi:hypothetical protein GGF46_000507 [Coemansia sp. RSA 552]|nr:hypothetical protein GGF46_000507 [Coemansia sp. RSA 552]